MRIIIILSFLIFVFGCTDKSNSSYQDISLSSSIVTLINKDLTPFQRDLTKNGLVSKIDRFDLDKYKGKSAKIIYYNTQGIPTKETVINYKEDQVISFKDGGKDYPITYNTEGQLSSFNGFDYAYRGDTISMDGSENISFTVRDKNCINEQSKLKEGHYLRSSSLCYDGQGRLLSDFIIQTTEKNVIEDKHTYNYKKEGITEAVLVVTINGDTTKHESERLTYFQNGLIQEKENTNLRKDFVLTQKCSYTYLDENGITVKRTCVDNKGIAIKNLSRAFEFDENHRVISIRRFLKGKEELRFVYE